tara:strand:+ start:129 stop:476 length:348 start_codon:yes stop_codon:yes gene_type:complete
MKYKGRELDYQYEYRRNRLLEIFELRGGKCKHCEVRDLKHIEIYDYHHIDPKKKDFNIGRGWAKPMKQVLAEAEKCLLLCANCHRIEHARMSRVIRDKRNRSQREAEEMKQMALL